MIKLLSLESLFISTEHKRRPEATARNLKLYSLKLIAFQTIFLQINITIFTIGCSQFKNYLIMILSRLSRISRFPLKWLCLSTCEFTTRTPTQIREMAIVSSHIINMIADQSQRASDDSVLSEKIKSLTHHQITSQQVSEEIFKEVMELFTSGVLLPKHFTSQHRIQIAQNKQSELFTFYPTWITSSFLFQHMRVKSPMLMFSGQPGVGKTSSFILYSILMNHVTSYYITLDQAHRKQLKKVIKFRPEKYFYWSFDADYGQQIVKELLVSQCYEMLLGGTYKEEQLKMLSLSDLCNKIYYFYYMKKSIDTVVIIDQINKLASLHRKYNQKIQQKQSDEKMKKHLQAYFYIRNPIAAMGKSCIYNSSLNIEEELIYKKHTEMGLTNLQIFSHQKLFHFSLGFHIRKFYQKAITETIYLSGQILRTIHNKSEEQITLEKSGIERHLSMALPFLRIREILSKPYQFQKIMAIEIKLRKDSFQDFLHKRSQNKEEKLTMFRVLKFIVQKMQQFQERHANIGQQQFFISIEEIQQEVKKKQSTINLVMDKVFFPRSDNKYYCSLPLKQALDIVADQLLDSLQTILLDIQKLIPDAFSNRTVLGILVEKAIIRYAKQSVDKKGQFYIRNVGYLRYDLAAESNFFRFNEPHPRAKVNPQQYYDNNLDQIIAKAYQHQGRYVFGTPIIKAQQKYNQQSNSFCTDFCFASYNQKQTLLKLYFYDVKVRNQVNKAEKNRDSKLLLQKVEKSLREYKKKNPVIKFEIKMIILCGQWCHPLNNAEKYSFLEFADIHRVRMREISNQSATVLTFLLNRYTQTD